MAERQSDVRDFIQTLEALDKGSCEQITALYSILSVWVVLGTAAGLPAGPNTLG